MQDGLLKIEGFYCFGLLLPSRFVLVLQCTAPRNKLSKTWHPHTYLKTMVWSHWVQVLMWSLIWTPEREPVLLHFVGVCSTLLGVKTL